MKEIWEWRFKGYTDQALSLAYHGSKPNDNGYHEAARDEICRRAFERRDLREAGTEAVEASHQQEQDEAEG